MVRILKNIEEISEEIANLLIEEINFQASSPIHIALSGGNTPKVIYKYLLQHYAEKLYDERLHFWWGDERCVEPTHTDSNYMWAKKLWLEPTGYTNKNIHRIHGENKPNEEAERYASEIEKRVAFKNDIPCFDIIFLGIGDDGHTASIFPNQMQLLNTKKLCEVATNPQSGQLRVSFTGRLINNAKHIIFPTVGKKKAQKVKEILIDKNLDLPATHIQPTHGKITWIIDQEASAHII